ncbi:MAG: hypothetical protein IAC29_07560 [Bacteroidetes bacterium]|uniref:Lipoprotein n=1 Tax=Candidatus Cryptobacteroides merdigallinarum TaxID=2840770 RepID=A0A9D9EPY6_9BACT|nr:hypothetical protein [Candidatus Cryptobacteroides merdigallinarum]
MNRSTFTIIGISLGLGSLVCGCIDPIPGKNDMNTEAEEQEMMPPLSEIAGLLAELPLEAGHMTEVHDAVSASSQNGYDEEYTMSNLFSVPGSGVGDEHLGTRAAQKYENPLSELIRDHLMSKAGTKSSAGGARFTDEEDVDRYLGALASSDIQVYWPFSGSWDGSGGLPVITFDPEDESTANIGYRITVDPDGNRQIDTVIVDEQTAMETPVWVVNRNSDDGYLSLDMIRQLYPGWEEEGGNIVIRPSGSGKAYGRMGTAPVEGPLPAGTGTATATVKTLVLKDFTMNRNYDSWFAGASEFFVKCGSVENFTASTEAELQLYSPSVTDFMIVVKRDQVEKPQPFNAVLISDWTEQVDNCAFMIIEDDGGKQTSWECTALVRVASKSYGIEIDLPFRTRDDIVWRGSLSSRYLTANNNRPENFGDVSITFEIEENGAE